MQCWHRHGHEGDVSDDDDDDEMTLLARPRAKKPAQFNVSGGCTQEYPRSSSIGLMALVPYQPVRRSTQCSHGLRGLAPRFVHDDIVRRENKIALEGAPGERGADLSSDAQAVRKLRTS